MGGQQRLLRNPGVLPDKSSIGYMEIASGWNDDNPDGDLETGDEKISQEIT